MRIFLTEAAVVVTCVLLVVAVFAAIDLAVRPAKDDGCLMEEKR